jgi:hypothetical protein
LDESKCGLLWPLRARNSARYAERENGPARSDDARYLAGHVTHDAIPAAMIFLSVSLNPKLNRWLNIVFGTIYTVIILITMWDWAFYIFYGVVEVIFTVLVVWYAWNWPREREDQA